MRSVIKWAGRIIGGLVVLLVILGGIIYMVGSSNVKKTYTVETADLTIPTDSASIAHGKRLTEVNGCIDCHGENLAGKVFVDAPPFLVSAANLTPGKGGVGATYTAEDFDRAIRHGVKKNGRPVVIMPSAAFHKLSDGDAASLIAYLQTVPAVDNDLPQSQMRFLGTMLASGPIDLEFEVRTEPARSEPAPPVAPTAEYGEYIASVTCAYCHGEDLQGLETPPMPDSPPSPNLAGAGKWPLNVFKATLKTGVKPNGDSLNVVAMPISLTKHFSDAELDGLHAYLGSLAN